MTLACRFPIGGLSVLVCAFCLTGLAQEAQPASGKEILDNIATLDLSIPGPGTAAGSIYPPPGRHDIPKDDIVLLQGRSCANPDHGPLWSGDVSGTGRLLSVQMDGAKRVTAAFDGAVSPSEDSPPVFDAPGEGALQTFLGSGHMHGWFSVNRSRQGVGAGITHLVTADNPCFPVFARPNLNFEHILNGAAADMYRSQNTPRTDAMQIRVLSPSSVEVCWPAATSSWSIDCRMRYTFSGNNAIDMDFEATPRKDEAPKGWLLFMWASYMQMVRARAIYFRGTDGGGERWVSFGKTGTSGTVAGAGQPDLSHDDGSEWFNVGVTGDVRFTLPFYYGLRDTDMDSNTTDDTTAFIMMFDDPMTTRFAVWNWGEDPTVAAWDWQFIVRSPQVGQTYRQRARMVCKRFVGEDDVLAEYLAWRETLSLGAQQPSLPVTACPVCLAPGNSAYNHAAIMDKVVRENPDLALKTCRRMLSSALYAIDAARRIDVISEKMGGAALLIEQWESIVSENPQSSLAWYHLGMAREKPGNLDKAADAYARVLQINGTDTSAKLRLGIVRVMLGETDSGLALVDEMVQKEVGAAEAAAKECSDLAKPRLKSGDVKCAADLYRMAVACSPNDCTYRMLCGGALESAGDYNGAMEQYRYAADISPESAYAAVCINAVYQKLGDTASRVSEWKRLSEAHPAAFTPAFHLGMALEDAGDWAKAKTTYQKLLCRYPENGETKIRLAGLVAAKGAIEDGLCTITALTAHGGEEMAKAAASACGTAAQARAAAGDVMGSRALLRQACILSPTNLKYRAALGESLEAAGDDNGALAEYLTVVEEAPASPESLHSGDRMDGIYRRRNDPAARVAEWKVLVQNHPDAAMPQLHLGMALEDSGDPSGAEAAYREALRLRPEGQDSKLRLGAIIAAKGKVEEGLQMVDEAARALPGLASLAAEGCGHAAKARASASDSAGALALAKRARELSPTDLRHRVALGEALEAAGDKDGALAEYRAVAEEAPESPESQRSSERMDGIYQRRGGAAARVAAWKDLVQNHPDAAMLHLYLGMALDDSGDDAGAEAAYREALRLRPEGQNSKLRLGALVAAKGCVEEGLRMLDEAVRAMPSLAGSAAEGCDRAAEARDAAGDSAGALALAKRARNLSPSDLRYRVALGGAFEAVGDDDGALDEYRAVVEQVPESPKSSARMDAILEKRVDKAARVDAWKRLVAGHPDAAIPNLHLGLALEASGDLPGARAAYGRVLGINPNLAEARAALDRINGNVTGAK